MSVQSFYHAYIARRTKSRRESFETLGIGTSERVGQFVRDWLDEHAPAHLPTDHPKIWVTIQFEPNAEDHAWAQRESEIDEDGE